MNTTFLSTTIFITSLGTQAIAACIPHGVSESKVSEKTYTLDSSPKVKLKFGGLREKEVKVIDPLAGHPGGKYTFQGNCHADVIISFDSKTFLHLKPVSTDFYKLENIENGEVFTIEIPEIKN